MSTSGWGWGRVLGSETGCGGGAVFIDNPTNECRAVGRYNTLCSADGFFTFLV